MFVSNRSAVLGLAMPNGNLHPLLHDPPAATRAINSPHGPLDRDANRSDDVALSYCRWNKLITENTSGAASGGAQRCCEAVPGNSRLGLIMSSLLSGILTE
jgi:hypothetical protein